MYSYCIILKLNGTDWIKIWAKWKFFMRHHISSLLNRLFFYCRLSDLTWVLSDSLFINGKIPTIKINKIWCLPVQYVVNFQPERKHHQHFMPTANKSSLSVSTARSVCIVFWPHVQFWVFFLMVHQSKTWFS